MSELPQSWSDCQLGVVVDYGKTRKCEPDDIPEESWVLELEDIEKDTSRLLDRQTFAQRQSKSTKNGFDAGDVLYGKLRPYLNKVLIADQPGYCTTEIVPLKAGPNLDGRYLFYWLKHPTFLAYVEAESHGLNMPRLGTDTGRAAPFVLAPRPEQTRIADKLDTVLARVDACRDRLDRIPAILKRFRQSVLATATSGKLTEDWRLAISGESAQYESIQVGDPFAHIVIAPMTWNKTTLGKICEFIGGSQPPKSTFTHTPGTDVVRLIQIRDYKSDKHITFIPKNLARRFCKKSDVMIGRYGPPIFQILRGLEGAYNVALMKAQPTTTELCLDYLYILLRGELLLKYVEAGSDRTAGQDGVRKELLEPYPVLLPPTAEQYEIVRRVETLFAFADRLEARYTAAHTQVEKLTPSLLAKAFRGELVPQDPNDEPASELLARIRAQHNAHTAGASKRGRGRKAVVS